jgi:anthranilate phosphoribosyltransferase
MTDAPAGRAWPDLLANLLNGQDLSDEDTAWAMDQIMRGDATSVQIAGFAVALRAKGETVTEIAGMVRAMYAHATTISVPGDIVDIVGTGGDRSRTVNISTMSAIVLAGAGARVVKHGNRAASSASGAADVLEELGVVLSLSPAQVAQVAQEAGITFCFAKLFHPALRHTATARGELAVPTVFNFLGPLTNPARPSAQAIGVSDARMAPIMAGVLAERGTSALVFRGDDGLDELTTTTTSHVWVVRDGAVREEVFDPRQIGIERVDPAALRGADAAHNAEVARRLLAGEPGPVRETVLLNAASALVAQEASDEPLAARLDRAVARAREAIDSGAAAAALDRWVAVTRKLAG